MLCRVYSSHPEFATPPDRLTIERRIEGDCVTLMVHGEIDLASAPELARHIDEAERSSPRSIVLDLAALEFIDSSGLHVLIEANGRGRRSAHRLILTHVPPHVQRIFSLTGVDAQFTFG